MLITIKKLKQLILKPAPEPIKPFEFPFDVKTLHQPEEKPVRSSKTLLKKNEIAFPYFCEQSSLFSKQHTFFKSKLGTHYKAFQDKVVTHLIMTTENQLITRRTPRHEWVTAYIIDDQKGDQLISYLLILGADLKTKPLSMGYASSVEDKYSFNPYFIFGCSTEITSLGTSHEERTVKGSIFHIYDFTNQEVIEKVLKMIESICERR